MRARVPVNQSAAFNVTHVVGLRGDGCFSFLLEKSVLIPRLEDLLPCVLEKPCLFHFLFWPLSPEAAWEFAGRQGASRFVAVQSSMSRPSMQRHRGEPGTVSLRPVAPFPPVSC